MKVSLIWAMSRNGVIGRDNALPWHLPREMKHFMSTTRGHPVIMGRRTFESMDRRPLPKRANVVVTSNRAYEAPGATVATSLDEALAAAHRHAAEMGVEEADGTVEVEGDTLFPEVDWSRWREVRRESFPADEANAHDFTVALFERR